mgnify:CR=1 FL=1
MWKPGTGVSGGSAAEPPAQSRTKAAAGKHDENISLAEAKNLVAAAQLSHEGVMAAVDLCLQLLEHAGLLYRTLDDDGRQTCNQARYNAIYFDADADCLIEWAERGAP